MTQYAGMRWYRCDFQVQTPEDARHWGDAETKLVEPRVEADTQEKARKYLARCHSLDLNVIGVTDHNFSSKTDPRQWFLTHLIEQNESFAQTMGRAPLCIFPGFEIDIGYHLLCLFEPVKKGAHLARISDVLTTLGLAPSARFEGGLPQKLRHDGASVSIRTVLNKVQKEEGGIVIAAHAFSDRGICNDPTNIGDFFSKDLMCVEVTEYPLRSKANQVLEGNDDKWRRPGRQPAYVKSSDAKSLQANEDGTPKANALGYRYSWLKMSQPSIEALRQAFLDSDSRVRLDELLPSAAEDHPRIVSLRVKGAAFLDDQQVVLSPNLNCVIGGRGSGKSSILEYLRFALQPQVDKTLPADIALKHEGIRKTLHGTAASVHVTFESVAGVSDTVVISGKGTVRRIDGREVVDLSTVLSQLQVQFFSQGELSRLTRAGENHVLRLVDAVTGDELAKLQRNEESLKGELAELAAIANRVASMLTELHRLEQELVELNRQWQARKDIQGDAVAQQSAQQAAKHVKSIVDAARSDATAIDELAGTAGTVVPELLFDADSWSKIEWFRQVERNTAEARRQYKLEVQAASAKFLEALDKSFGQKSEWPAVKADLDAAEQRFVDACREKGLQPQDVSRLQEVDRQRMVKQADHDAKRVQLEQLRLTMAGTAEKLTALHGVWRAQFSVRQAACLAMESTSKATAVAISYMRDRDSFNSIWRRLAPTDNRTRLAKSWDELGDAVFAAHGAQSTIPSPWELIERWRHARGDVVDEALVLQTHFPELLEHIDSEPVRATWSSVWLTRVEDFVDVELMRPDGTSAGKMSGAGGKVLSEGQRNTALLTLILAQGR